MNITDDEGDTPLYTVENIETARFLVERGAVVSHRNNEGVSVSLFRPEQGPHVYSFFSQPIEHLSEDFASVAEFLQILTNEAPTATTVSPVLQPSQHSQNVASEQLTSALMESVRHIMERAEAEGIDPEQELHQAVTRAVLEGVVTGYDMSIDQSRERNQPPTSTKNDTPSKRARTDNS